MILAPLERRYSSPGRINPPGTPVDLILAPLGRRYSSPCRAQALPMCRATWVPRLFNTHGTNKLRRSTRRHSPPCRAFALPMCRATWGPRLFNTHAASELRRSVRRHSPPCRAPALCLLSIVLIVRGTTHGRSLHTKFDIFSVPIQMAQSAHNIL